MFLLGIHIYSDHRGLPPPGDEDPDDPGAGHDDVHGHLVFALGKGCFGFVIHGSHARHGGHVVIDENLGIGDVLPLEVLYFDLHGIVPLDGGMLVQSNEDIVICRFLLDFQAPGMN